jgi:hypothetical protein
VSVVLIARELWLPGMCLLPLRVSFGHCSAKAQLDLEPQK